MKKQLYRQSGFTLLELIISLAICALIVQFAIPSYQAYIERAKSLEAQAQSMQDQITALQP